jgi:hypothetical protein
MKKKGGFIRQYEKDSVLSDDRISKIIRFSDFSRPKMPKRTHTITVRYSTSKGSKTISLWNNQNLSFDDIFETIKYVCWFKSEDFFENCQKHTLQHSSGNFQFTHYLSFKDIKTGKSKSFGLDLGDKMSCEEIKDVIEKILKKNLEN